MNKVLLTGRLTRDIDLRKTQNGTSFGRFTLAVDRRFRSNNQEGGNQREADFVSCIVWDKRAETMYQYLGKGSLIGVEGRIQTGSYEKDGQRIYTTDVVVENFDFLESRAQRDTAPNVQASYGDSFSNNQTFDEEGPSLDLVNEDLPF